MITGISMGLETCLILGQVSHNLLYSTKKLPKDICGPGETENGKRHSGQIIYGQNSGPNWEEIPSCGTSKKWSIEKPQLDNAGRLRGIYFIEADDKELKETIRNVRKKLDTNGSRYALQDTQEK